MLYLKHSIIRGLGRRPELVIFLICIIIGTIILYLSKRYANPNTFEQDTIANNLLTGKGFLFEEFGAIKKSFTFPVYSYLLYITYYFFPKNYFVVILLQIVLIGFSAVMLFKIAQYLLPFPVNIFSSLFAMLHPGIWLYAIKNIHPFSLDMALFLFTFYITFKLFHVEVHNRMVLFVSGLIFGVTILNRSSIIIYILSFLIFWYYLLPYKLKYETIQKPIIILIGIFIVISPWLIRNYSIHHKIVFTSDTMKLFWLGNNTNATGTLFYDDGLPYSDHIPKDIFGKGELEQMEIFKKEAINFIKSDPLKFLRLSLKKFYYFWWFSPAIGKMYNPQLIVAYKYFYTIILPLFIFSIIFLIFFSSKSINFLYILFPFSISIVHSLTYVEGRHRLILEPLMILLSIYSIWMIRNIIRKKYTIVEIND